MSDQVTLPPPSRSITTLPEQLELLPLSERARFDRLYHVSRSTGHIVVPEASRGWVSESFGSVEAVETQTVVRLTNLVTLEGAI
ncbi:MAG TPA: hypothetical protein VF960_12900, partial [Chloroflexota bacterium]